MNLPQPGTVYSQENESQTRNILEQEDKKNQKRGADVVIKDNRLILTSPDGTQWSGTIDNLGTVSWTAL